MTGLLRSEVTLFREARSIIAESTWWDGDALRWCDIDTGSIHTSRLAGGVDGRDDLVQLLPAPMSGFQPLASGPGFVFAGLDFIGISSDDGRPHTVLARVDHRSDRMRFNEAKCDPFGRFIVGSMSLEGQPDAAIYSIDHAGHVETLVGGIGVANGFEWSEDGHTMWFTDTATTTIYEGDYTPGGVLSNVRPFIVGRMSDGLARDVDGGFWNGIYDVGHVVHFDPSGQADLEIDIPAVHVTAVGFGGADRSTLFIATARENATERQLEDNPLTGSIFQVETTTRGFPTRTFGTPQEGN